MLNVINGVYHPQQGSVVFRATGATVVDPHEAARRVLRAPSEISPFSAA